MVGDRPLAASGRRAAFGDVSAVAAVTAVAAALLLIGGQCDRRRGVRRAASALVWAALAMAAASWLAVRSGHERPLASVLMRLAAAMTPDAQQVSGGETRIGIAPDGHFWVDATIGGRTRPMLVDSGATRTTLSSRTAEIAGAAIRGPMVPTRLRTAGGVVVVRAATLARIQVGSVTLIDLPVLIDPAADGLDVIGMNFLSELAGWRVEDGMLVLTPPHTVRRPTSAPSRIPDLGARRPTTPR